MSDTCVEEIHSARLVAVFANPQSAFGTQATDYAATDAVGAESVQGRGAPIYSTPSRKGAGFAQAATTPLREPGIFDLALAGPLLPSGSTGGVPNLDNLLSNSMFMDTDTGGSTTVSGGGSTTSVVDVTDASAYTALVSAIEIGGEVAITTAVDTASTPDNVTVFPPLSTAPADTTTVSAVKSYRISNTAHVTQPACTVHAIMGGGVDLVLLNDAISATFALSGEMEGEIQYELGLQGASGGEGSRLTLSGTLNTGDTAIPINETGGTDVPPIGAVMQVRGGTETGMVVTASETGGSFTATRGSNPDSGVANDKLDYYIPGLTIPDGGIPSRSGTVYFGTDTAICDAGFKLNVNYDPQWVACRSNLDRGCRVSPGNVEVTIEMTLPVDRLSYGKIRASLLGGYDQVGIRMGSTSGLGAVIYAQKATIMDMPGFDASGDGQMELNIVVHCHGNTDTERPIVIAVQ